MPFDLGVLGGVLVQNPFLRGYTLNKQRFEVAILFKFCTRSCETINLEKGFMNVLEALTTRTRACMITRKQNRSFTPKL